MEPNQYATPAACIQTFLSGAVGVHLPTREHWVEAYKADKELSAILFLLKTQAPSPSGAWKRQRSTPIIGRHCGSLISNWTTAFSTTTSPL